MAQLSAQVAAGEQNAADNAVSEDEDCNSASDGSSDSDCGTAEDVRFATKEAQAPRSTRSQSVGADSRMSTDNDKTRQRVEGAAVETKPPDNRKGLLGLLKRRASGASNLALPDEQPAQFSTRKRASTTEAPNALAREAASADAELDLTLCLDLECNMFSCW